MAKVFLSHASQDRACAHQLHRWLVGEDHEVFLDQDLRDGIPVGDEWDKRLHERLRWADAVVCVVTKAAVASMWCTAEISIARSQGSRLLPVRAEPGVDHPLLGSVQYADLGVDPVRARAALVEALCQIDAAGGLGWPDDRSPFPGLRPFDVEDHRVFFGRTDEVERLAGLLRSPAERAEERVLLVVGPSGCGKSSLVRAGLLHEMAGEVGWLTLAPMLPGGDPVGALVRELAAGAQQIGLDWTVSQVRERLDAVGLTELADELLLAAPGGRRRRLLIVVDQFEELLTQATPSARARFAQLLGPVLGGSVQLVATLRPEFLDQLLVDVDLAALPTRPYPLRPLCRDALSMVIQGPAQMAGLTVADDLVARVVADTDSGEALPLLAFTLAQLADGVSRGDQLSQRRYDHLGGVQGALTRQAEAALEEASAASGRSRDEVIAGLLRLVTVDEQSRPTRWRIPRDELPELVTRELDAFARRRLLTTDTEDNGRGRVVIGVAHEAFLSAWPPLTQAIEKNASALRARRAVEQAATDWHNKGRPPTRLWERTQLASALADTGAHLQAHELVTDRVELGPTARAFLRASIRRDRLQRGRAVTILSTLLILALTAFGIVFIQQRVAEQQRDVAVSRQVSGQALELRDANPALAQQLALTAYRLAPTVEARSTLLSVSAIPYSTRLIGTASDFDGMALSPDGHILANTSTLNTAQLWDIHDPHHPIPLSILTGHKDGVTAVAFSPDGHTLATASNDGTARLWEISDPRHPTFLSILTGHDGVVTAVAFSPDGHTLATASNDTTARLWEISDPRHPTLLSILTGHKDIVISVAFSPDGHTLATASWDRTVRLWEMSDLHHPTLLTILVTGHTDAIYAVAFRPGGRILATASLDSTARLWDISDPHRPTLVSTLTGHNNGVTAVAFSPDGHTLATASTDTTARLWDISDPHRPTPLSTLTGHTGAISAVAFDPGGHSLATASVDGTMRLWDLPGPVIVAGHADSITSVAFRPGGHILATTSLDGTARLWEISDPRNPVLLSTLTGHNSGVTAVAFSPDGQTLATASNDTTALLWDIHDLRHPTRLSTLTGHTGEVFSVAFSPGGHIVATASNDTTTQLWEISDPRKPVLLSTLTGRSGVLSVAFSPDGQTLASSSDDSSARLWEIRDPRNPVLLSTLTGHTGGVWSVAFSPGGHTLATASIDGTARLWDVHDLQYPTLLSTLTGHTGGVFSVAFSPDGHTLATTSNDTTARMWDIHDLQHPTLLSTLTGHTRRVNSVAFSLDGQLLATGAVDGTARMWETNVDRVAARICSITLSTTKREWEHYLPDLAYRPPCS